MTTAERAESKSPYPHLAVLAGLPFFLLVVNSNWIFNPAGSIDPWVYYGFFTHLRQFATSLFPDTYYGSRLAWILPGYLVNQLLPPLAANYVLHVAFYYMAVFPLYSILRHAVGGRAALLGCILGGSYHYFLTAIGWDYVDGAGIAYYLLASAGLVAAADSARPWRWLLLSGSAYAAMLYCNIFWIIFSPFFAALLWFVRPGGGFSWSGLARHALFFVLGSALVTAFLGLASYLIDGRFWFYSPSIGYALQNVAQPNPWRIYNYHWMRYAGHLLFPGLLLVGSIIYVFSYKPSKADPGAPLTMVFCLNLIGSIGILMVWELKGTPIFEYAFKTSHLIPAMLLVIGPLFCRGADRLKPAHFTAIVTGVLVLYPLPFWGINRHTNDHTIPVMLVVSLGCGLAGMIVRVVWPGSVAALCASVVGLSACHDGSSVGSNWAGDVRHARRDDFEAVVQGMKVVDAELGKRAVRFWYNVRDPNGPVFTGINSAYLWGYTWIGRDFPALPEVPSAKALGPGVRLVVLSSGGNAFDLARGPLAGKRFRAILAAHKEIIGRGHRYSITFIDTDPADREAAKVTFDRRSGIGRIVANADEGAAEISLDRWQLIPDPASRMSREQDGLMLVTPKGRWAYAAVLGPLAGSGAGEYGFEARFHLISGRIAFGALSGPQDRWIAQAEMWPDGEDQIAGFRVRLKAGEQFWLLTTNNHPDGDRPSTYVLRNVRAFVYGSAPDRTATGANGPPADAVEPHVAAGGSRR
jgi:hypothetical protein